MIGWNTLLIDDMNFFLEIFRSNIILKKQRVLLIHMLYYPNQQIDFNV